MRRFIGSLHGLRVLRNIAGSIQLAYLRTQPGTSSPKLSFCTSVKDRFEHLRQTLVPNLEYCRAYRNFEFVLLDYNCPDPRTKTYVLEELGTYVESGELTYYYFPQAKYFDRSHARNLGFCLGTGDILCNVDADNFIGEGFPHFVASMLCEKNVFLQGPQDGRGLLGRICLHRHHFEAVGGFDERMAGWGAEDEDLGRRLELLGVTKRGILAERFCSSILHDDLTRTRHHRETDMQASLRANRAYLTENVQHGIVNPNGTEFGAGRVQKNGNTWIEA